MSKENYIKIPKDLVNDARLSAFELGVYCFILSIEGNEFNSVLVYNRFKNEPALELFVCLDYLQKMGYIQVQEDKA